MGSCFFRRHRDDPSIESSIECLDNDTFNCCFIIKRSPSPKTVDDKS